MTDTADAVSGMSAPLLRVPTIRTFLLSDIRGYTRFTAERGSAAAAELSEHFVGLCREVVSSHGGEVFGSAGDQALAAFSSARAALYAALALQSRLTEEQTAHPDLLLRAGVGLDAGEAIQLGSDYRGHPINRAARLCSIAGGGEIFASDVVITLAQVTEGMAVVDRGEVSLKGLPHPVRVVQVGPEGALPDSLPPLQPILVTHPTNLPDERTPFIGRSGEITEISGLLGNPRVRLVTLVGPGGTGKTRLALQVGMSLLYSFRDGVFFVDLSPVSDPAFVLSAIAEALGVKEEGSSSLLDEVIARLKEKQLLLVLDNCEQIVDAAPEVGMLLDSCREVRVLATSRVPLHLAREREYAVSPLAVPDPDHLPSLDQLEQYEAVALFIDRAGAAKHGFTVTNENAPAVAQICHRLDGLPLAIELAAARIKLFPPAALLQRLDSRLKLLTGGARDRPSRQQTLRGAIDWSYSLLTEEEQLLFARLSVFSGGCSFEAAEVVSNPDGELDLLDGMASLVDKSLLRQEGEEEPRFRMLETIREYAGEKLREAGEEEQIRTGHAEFFLCLAEEAERALDGPEQRAWLSRLDAELDNLRDASGWLLAQGRAQDELRLVTATSTFWEVHGHWREAQRWVEMGLERIENHDPALQAKALGMVGQLLFRRGVYDESADWLGRGIEQADRVGDVASRARNLKTLGSVHSELQQFEQAEALLDESLQLFRELGMRGQEATVINRLGAAAQSRGDLVTARQRFEEALALHRACGSISEVITTQYNLGVVAHYEGNPETAQRWYSDALTAARELGDKMRIVWALLGLGVIARQTGRLEEAERLTAECLALARVLDAKIDISAALVLLGGIVRQRGHLDEAREHLLEGIRVARDIGEIFAELEGLDMMANLAEAEGRRERAVQLKAAELAERERTHIQPDAFGAAAGEALCARLQTSLGEERFAQAWREGQCMSLEEAIAFALEETSAG